MEPPTGKWEMLTRSRGGNSRAGSGYVSSQGEAGAACRARAEVATRSGVRREQLGVQPVPEAPWRTPRVRGSLRGYCQGGRPARARGRGGDQRLVDPGG